MPRAPVEEPTVTQQPKGGHSEEVTRHPCYAQIGASRVSGDKNLYASDFRHNAFMTIAIRRSELHRSLSNDWHFGKEELIHVALSEAQWATFVSSPNVGQGVPCTLEYFNGEQIPQLPDPADRTDQFGKEATARMADGLANLDAVKEAIRASGISQRRGLEIERLLDAAKMQLSGNVKFVADQFGEHMEKTVEKAKAEVHGYMTGALMRSGLAALTGGEMPLQLEARTADEAE